MAASPIVLLANYYQFGRGQCLEFGPVLSCMQLWCRAGHGVITIDGIEHDFSSGSLVLLPWGHHIAYRASRKAPFLVAGVHVIPLASHEIERMPFNQVPHFGKSLAGLAEGEHPLSRPPRLLALADHPALFHLGEAAVSIYQRNAMRGRQAVPVMRQLGALFLGEWAEAVTSQPESELDQPLKALRQFVLSHLSQPISRDDLAHVISASPSTLARLLKRTGSHRPAEWVRQIRLEEARKHIAGSNQTLAEIAAATGFCDAFHLSRAFRSAFGHSPTEWRRSQLLPW